jgi:hypothetical protein
MANDDSVAAQPPAGAELVRHLDDDLRAKYPDRTLPWERNVAVGEIDYFRIHAYALDRLEEVLLAALPDGELV